ncbi:MAG: phosphoglucosamine mutase [Haloarculaceae archaeon]
MHVFGSSGVRGVVNEELTPGDVVRIAQAAGTVWEGGQAALARDTRATGRMLTDAAAAGLAGVGVGVDRLGVVPTPALQAFCEREGVPGLMVTASHNPPEYNGVKLIAADGVEMTRAGLDEVEETLAGDRFASATWDETGETRQVEEAAADYVAGLLGAVDRAAIAEADLTVVVDPGHGAGCVTSPDFFRELGCTVHTVNAQPDSAFPGRHPEPVAEHLGALCEHVRATDADLGVAHDGDADRATFVDETGSPVNGDAALAALVDAAVGPGDVVVSAANASRRLIDVTEASDADLTLTPIGSTNIVSRVRELRAEGESVPVAGEGNGGVIFPGYRTARDGAYTAAKFLERVVDRSASDLIAEYDDYHNVRRSVAYGDEGRREAMVDAIERVARDAVAELDTTDGYRLDYGDGWVLARPSGTEPLIRIYAEARTEDRAEELIDMMADALDG